MRIINRFLQSTYCAKHSFLPQTSCPSPCRILHWIVFRSWWEGEKNNQLGLWECELSWNPGACHRYFSWLGSGASSFCVSSRISMESELVVAVGSPQGSHGGSRFWLEFGGIVCIEPSVNTCCRAENHALVFFFLFFFLFRPSTIKFYRNIGKLKR